MQAPQRFFEVYFDIEPLYKSEPIEVVNKFDDLWRSYALPFYAELNGTRGRSNGFLRRDKFAFGNYRGVVVKLLSHDQNVEVGEIVNHGERGPFTGTFLYTYAKVRPEPFIKLPRDVETIGQAVIDVYQEGLDRLRGSFGMPKDFLNDFVTDMVQNRFAVEFEHHTNSFPSHKLITRFVSVSSPIEERHYLCVRRMRKSCEARVHVGTIGKPHVTQMHFDPTFDGENFNLVPWLKAPSWPVSYCRNKVSLEEFAI